MFSITTMKQHWQTFTNIVEILVFTHYYNELLQKMLGMKMLLPLRAIEFEFNLEYTVMRTNMKFERHKKAAAPYI